MEVTTELAIILTLQMKNCKYAKSWTPYFPIFNSTLCRLDSTLFVGLLAVPRGWERFANFDRNIWYSYSCVPYGLPSTERITCGLRVTTNKPVLFPIRPDVVKATKPGSVCHLSYPSFLVNVFCGQFDGVSLVSAFRLF